MIATVQDQRYFDRSMDERIDAAAKEAQDAARMAAATEQQVAATRIAWQADVEITYKTALSLNLAPRTAVFVIQGAKVNDLVYVHRRFRPKLAGVNLLAGVIIEGTAFVPDDGGVEVYHVIPAVGVGQTLSIPLRLRGFRLVTS